MELNWSTFIFEIINFLVLVWILKHFLYKPVQRVMARRQAEIDQKLSNAQTLQTENEQLNTRYLDRVNEWEKERQQKRHELEKELEQERARQLAELQQRLQQEQDKAQVTEQRRQEDAMRQLQETALKSAGHFASTLLQQGASAETETRLIDSAITDMNQLTELQKIQLRSQYGEPPKQITIQTAFPLADTQRQALEQAINTTLQLILPFDYEVNKELIAGTRIIIGNWVLGLNIQDELNGFAELSHEQ